MHLHAIANQQRIRHYIYGFLSDNIEKCQFYNLFDEHVLRINDSVNEWKQEGEYIHLIYSQLKYGSLWNHVMNWQIPYV